MLLHCFNVIFTHCFNVRLPHCFNAMFLHFSNVRPPHCFNAMFLHCSNVRPPHCFNAMFYTLSQCHTAILFQRHISTLTNVRLPLFFIYFFSQFSPFGLDIQPVNIQIHFYFITNIRALTGLEPLHIFFGGICQYCVKNINRVYNYVRHLVTDYATVQQPHLEVREVSYLFLIPVSLFNFFLLKVVDHQN